jgi:16S rRNA (cytidine1402-2'-O)-methyltransferase
VVRGPAHEVAARLSEAPKGEITLVVGPAAPAAANEAAAVAAVAQLVAAGTPRKTAADVVARLLGVSRKRLYDASL